ncbi:carboxypeptidase-like regulatory domain-containing protein [Frigoriglobus tundricola]|uniref:Carboxypeptidase regulatory-like domain-containing protein n=1 Tax=Frigoriglobus tundricola TaxID=2774151 RepID=A0A6M5YIC2_9BACT|nr:carboxypeptidase-like regulatory domain-containing protein [Frigoriglobus tundricola]QJW92993.1 hypothetical protein FTUN_0493 [Frigoriglobus tundricola]
MAVLLRLQVVAAAAFVAVASGCGSPTATVSGTVTGADGKPATGLIVFAPQDATKYREAVEGAIVDGHYALPAVPPGPKWVNVTVTRNGVHNPSLAVTPAPKEVDLKSGPQVIDSTLSKLR